MPDILFPAGRMVGGNLDKLFPRTEANGTPKIGKDGQPEMQCSFGYAIPKTHAAERWQDTPWGQIIYQTGAAAYPNLVASPAFSWKITDGDSTLPNKKGKRPCDQVGHVGHWVIWFSQGRLPKKWLVAGGTNTELTAEGAIVPGYYIEVFGSVAGNKLVPNGTPGVYLNPIHVGLVGEGERIVTEVDVSTVGFGKSAAPAGAKPITAATPQFAAPAAAPQFAAPAAAPAPAPNPAILQVAPPPAAPARVMTSKAGGATYEQFVSGGWTDDMLRKEGYML